MKEAHPSTRDWAELWGMLPESRRRLALELRLSWKTDLQTAV